jgi:hypothetical protein
MHAVHLLGPLIDRLRRDGRCHARALLDCHPSSTNGASVTVVLGGDFCP